MIKPYLTRIINNHNDEWKIQLTIEINFISTKDSSELSTMHIKCENIVILIGFETNEIFEKLDSLLEKYQEGLKENMKKSDHAFDSIDLLYYKLHKISLHNGGSYLDPP